MNQEDYIWRMEYWLDKLHTQMEYAQPLIKKLNDTPLKEFTYEELFMLRGIVNDLRAYDNIAQGDKREYYQKPVKKSLFKRFFHK